MYEILIVDDEPNILSSLETFLQLTGYKVHTAPDLKRGQQLFTAKKPQAAIVDVFLQGDDGTQLLKEIRRQAPDTIVIMISGHGDVALAISALRLGAYDFLEKPIDTEKLKVTLENGLRQSGLLHQLARLKERWLHENFIVGQTARMQELLRLAEKAGPTRMTVLIQGDSGTGKELMAYYLYLNSGKLDAPYLAVNCAAIQPELFESTLFGHKKGSFTGAVKDHPGYFKSADGGTLFLDEIGEIPLHLQVKLLRAIEYNEIQGIGYESPVKVDTRILCATNLDLAAEVRAGRFREDLYFRLSQVPLRLPPLAQRREDIPLFVVRFQEELAVKNGLAVKRLTPKAMAYLQQRPYSGNIRELRNLIGRLTLLSSADSITTAEILSLEDGATTIRPGRSESLFEQTMPYQEAKKELEKKYLETQLAKHSLSIKETAQALEILPNNLSRKVAELGITLHRGDESTGA